MVASHYKSVQPLKERSRWWWHHENRRRGWRGGEYSGETGGWWRWTRTSHRSGYASRFSTQVHFATSAAFSPVEGQRFHCRVWPCISVWPQTSFLERAFDYSHLTRMFVLIVPDSLFSSMSNVPSILFCKAACSLTIFCNVSFLLDNFYRVFVCQAKSPAAGNIFWKSSAWRRGMVSEVRMCPRAEMWKPTQGMSMQAAFTDVQEYKQVSYPYWNPNLISCYTMWCFQLNGLPLAYLIQLCSGCSRMWSDRQASQQPCTEWGQPCCVGWWTRLRLVANACMHGSCLAFGC